MQRIAGKGTCAVQTKDSPKIAAIVPVYNVEQYLEQCVTSLLSQSYHLHEIILIDDGSTDNSGKICDYLAAANPVIRVVHKKNAGLGYARNTGLNNLSGDISHITFVDSDDWLEPSMIETLVNELMETSADGVIAGFTKRDDAGNEQFCFQLEDATYEGQGLAEHLVPRVCGSAPSLSDSIPMSVCSALLKRKTIDCSSLRFLSEREVLSEDFFFKYAYLSMSRRIRVSSCIDYNYRTNGQSLTTSYRPDRFAASLHFYNLAKNAVADSPVVEECLRRLQKTLFIYVRASIAQERRSVSGKSYTESVATIDEIMRDPQLLEIISSYPLNELGRKQRTFIKLIQSGLSGIMYELANFGVFS